MEEIGGVQNSFGPGWIKDHATACKKAGKPCLLEECKLAWACPRPFDILAN